jgi:hypothetical protein
MAKKGTKKGKKGNAVKKGKGSGGGGGGREGCKS